MQHEIDDVAPFRKDIAAALHGIVGPKFLRPAVVDHVGDGELRRGQKGARGLHGRKKAELEAGHPDHPGPFHRRDRAVAVGEGEGERLFDEHMLARPGRRRRQGGMRVVLGADPHGVDFRIGPDPRRVGGGVAGAELAAKLLRARAVDIHDRAQPGSKIGREEARMFGPIAAAADDRCTDDSRGAHEIGAGEGAASDGAKDPRVQGATSSSPAIRAPGSR